MTKQNIRCDACGCAFAPEPKTQREGEIEYSFFNCDYCGKAYIVSVTDTVLRRDIDRYAELAERHKRKRLSEQQLREAARLKESNIRRSAELRKMYLNENGGAS
jgi:hypothetical protein